MTKSKSNMYPDTGTWNPFVGCRYDCVYCRPSFQRQVKRVAGIIGCEKCYNYEPHTHPERLETSKIPSKPIVFPCGTGDIAFAEPGYVRRILEVIDRHQPRIDKTYYFQSKNPRCFNRYLDWFKENRDKVILLTTLETNRDQGYHKISRAPPPSIRFRDFLSLDYSRKAVTIEPVLDFDIKPFLLDLLLLENQGQGNLEYVWFGYDSKNTGLPEPDSRKAQKLVDTLQSYDIEVRGKTLRNVTIG